MFSGYLTFTKQYTLDGQVRSVLKIPNLEVKAFYRNTLLRWFEKGVDIQYYHQMLKNLVDGNSKDFKKIFKDVVYHSFSYFDVANRNPERVYHAFALGMFVSLSNTHIVKSNRESGYGRYDVMIIPKDKSLPGTIIEFKKVEKDENENLEIAAGNAIKQINEKQYEQELVSLGIKKIIKLGIAFEGKKVFILESGVNCE